MKTLIVTEVRVYLYKNNYYASESFMRILQRYKKSFKTISLLTRIIDNNNIPNGYVKITNICRSFNNSVSIIHSLKQNNKEFIDLVKNHDFIILRVPSMISFRIYKYIKKYNKKYMTESMGCAWDAYWNHGIIGKLVSIFGYYNMKKIVFNADYATYVTSEFLQKRYPCKNKSIGVSNVSINHVENFKNYNNFNKFKFSMLTAAAVDVKYKGQQFVLKAIKDLKKNNINVTYYLAGGGNQSYLKKISKRYNIDDNVIFLGQLSKKELFDIYKKIDIYIQPSLQEGLPRSVIEAMSCGLICVGSKTAGIPELLQNECLFDRKSSKSIKKILLYIINECNLEKISDENCRNAKKYLEDNLNKKRFDYYKEIGE